MCKQIFAVFMKVHEFVTKHHKVYVAKYHSSAISRESDNYDSLQDNNFQ